MTLSYQNTPVHVESNGRGPALILLHGFLENSRIWDPFIPALERTQRVITIDLFGHGASPSLSDIHEMETFADLVSFVMEALKIGSAKIVGHSMGGYVAMAFVESHPEKTQKLMLMNSSPSADSEARKKERDQVIKIVKKHKEVFTKMAITNLFAETNRKRFGNILEKHISAANRMSVHNIISAVKGMKSRKDREAVFQSYPGEKWIIAGEDDSLIPFRNIKAIAHKAGAKLIALPGGHLSYIEAQAEVREALIAFANSRRD